MAHILCLLLVFFSLAQPALVFKGQAWADQLFFMLAAVTAIFSLLRKLGQRTKGVVISQSKFVYAIVVAYTLSEAQYLWLSGIVAVFFFWAKKALLFHIIVENTETPGQLRRLMWAVIMAGVFLIWSGWNLYLEHPELLTDKNRLESVGNYNLSNSFAFFISLLFPLGFAVLETSKKPMTKIFMLAFLTVSIITSFYTRSRGGTLALMIGACLSLLLSKRFVRSRILKVLAIVLLTMAFVGVGVIIVLSGRTDADNFLGGAGEASSGDRLMAWIAAVRMFVDHPLFGVGWNHFTEYVRDYGLDKKLIAHNTPLSVLAETGIFGFFCFIAIIVTSFKQLLAMRRWWMKESGSENILILCNGVLVSLIIYLINSSVSVKDYDPIYWVVLTFAAILTRFYNNSINNIVIRYPSSKPAEGSHC